MYGELFGSPFHPRPVATGFGETYSYDDDPVAFLRRVYEHSWCSMPSLIGFKLFYGHAREGAAKGLWRWLAGQHDVLVLHLTRRNRLATVVSLAVAERTGVWALPPGDDPPPPPAPFSIDPHECAEEFAWLERRDQWVARKFRHRRYLHVTYEDLTGRFDEVVGDVWRFTGLPAQPARRAVVRQRQLPVRRQVANFDELHRHFAGTRHEWYFCDDELEVIG